MIAPIVTGLIGCSLTWISGFIIGFNYARRTRNWPFWPDRTRGDPAA